MKFTEFPEIRMERDQIFEFGAFLLDPSARTLLRDGQPVALTPRAFDTLLALVAERGRTLSKEKLLRIVWGDVFVEENNLSQSISALRRALGDDGNGNRYIATVPRKGYCFVAPVTESKPPEAFTERLEAPELEARPIAPVSTAVSRRAVWRQTPVVAAAVALLLTLLGFGIREVARSRRQRELASVRSIAVLPFKPIPDSGADAYLGLALADALITRLSRIETLSVRPTSAVRALGADAGDPAMAGRRLAVEAVLDGQLQKSGDRIRVTVQLVDTVSGVTLWSEKTDVRSTDLFAVEDNVSEELARRLERQMPASPRASAAASRTPRPEAYEAFLRGRYEWNRRTHEGFLRAVSYFEQALRADPQYAPAYAGLADCRNFLGDAPGARAAASRALTLDPNLAQAHAALGNVSLFYDYDRAAAERELDRAIALNPSYATAYQWLAYGLVSAGRFPEAVAAIGRARTIDPVSLSIATDVADILYYSRRYDEAERECRKALELDPGFDQAHLVLGHILEQKKDLPGAIAEFESVRRIPDLARVYALSGRDREARQMLADLGAAPAFASPFMRAQAFAGLGETTVALEWLEKAYADRDGVLVLLGVDPQFDSLRSDPRFEDLLRRIRLRSEARAS